MKLPVAQIKPNPNNPLIIKDDKFKKLEVLTCKTCNKEFTSSKNCATRKPKYCTKLCYAESIKKYKPCTFCGEMFANYKNSSFCNNTCKNRYVSANKLPYKERQAKYRHARRSRLSVAIDEKFLRRLLEVQRNKCFYCEQEMTYRAVEHTQPVSRGGDNEPFNLVWSCKSCNSKKKDKTLAEYAIKTGNLQWLDKADRVFVGAYYGV